VDLSTQVSKGEYRRLAARWRRLAVEATTPKTRNHLLTLARQCEFLAGGDSMPVVAADAPEEPRLLDAPQ
jgi:hypothetical protein